MIMVSYPIYINLIVDHLNGRFLHILELKGKLFKNTGVDLHIQITRNVFEHVKKETKLL